MTTTATPLTPLELAQQRVHLAHAALDAAARELSDFKLEQMAWSENGMVYKMPPDWNAEVSERIRQHHRGLEKAVQQKLELFHAALRGHAYEKYRGYGEHL
jgi:hypothetical protein